MINPAPGHILVLPDSRKTDVAGVELAVSGGETHEGEVIAVGHKGRFFRKLDIVVGDSIIYARFNAVSASVVIDGVDTKCRLVAMHHVMGIRRDGKPKGWLSSWFHISSVGGALRFGFISGVVASTAYAKLSPIIRAIVSRFRNAAKNA